MADAYSITISIYNTVSLLTSIALYQTQVLQERAREPARLQEVPVVTPTIGAPLDGEWIKRTVSR